MYLQFSRASMFWAVILLVVVEDGIEKVREEVELKVVVLLVIMVVEFGKAGGEVELQVERVNEGHEVVEETEVVIVSGLSIFLSVALAPEENCAAVTEVNFILHLIGLMCIWTNMHSIILQN